MAYNFTIGTSGRWSIAALAFQNPHASVIYDVASSNTQTGSADLLNAADITTNNANSIHVVAWGADGAANVFSAAPGSYVERARVDTNQTLLVASLVIASPGATGEQTGDYTNTNGAFAFSFAIRDNGTTTFRSSSTNSASTGTAVSVTEPSGVTAGDLVIVVVHCNNVTTIVDNNGGAFTEDVNDYQEASAGLTAALFSMRVAGGGGTTRGMPFGHESTAFAGGRTFAGILRRGLIVPKRELVIARKLPKAA